MTGVTYLSSQCKTNQFCFRESGHLLTFVVITSNVTKRLAANLLKNKEGYIKATAKKGEC